MEELAKEYKKCLVCGAKVNYQKDLYPPIHVCRKCGFEWQEGYELPKGVYFKKIPWWKMLFKPKKIVVPMPKMMRNPKKWMVMYKDEFSS